MRIATWNINGLKARLDYLKHWLRAIAPDIVGLQELKSTDEAFPHSDFADLGYRAVTHGQKAWNGVAVLSREPVEVTQVGLPGQEEFGARLLSVRTESGLAFTTLYGPNGKTVTHPDFERKLAWFDQLLSHLGRAGSERDPLIICGDFNIVPAAIDSWNEEQLAGSIFHTAAERERLEALCAWGLRDLYRALHPEEPGHTWWDYRAGAFHKRMGLRIDLLLATAPVLEKAVGATVERTWRKKVDGLTPSDHAPVWVDLKP